ncbi:potassium channel subfamily K member 10-like [Penaeus chinensis]|uniref:potassium channel subfamily K member 10-like n=1 Tax=Penaeus chinensis TaxID=139456 RepID=UPI001FB5E531|nr:potassium channel subfamily K member 10-like [Penaeus chinensis]
MSSNVSADMQWLQRWLSANCSDLANSTIETLISEGSHPDAVQEVEYQCPHLHQVELLYRMTFTEYLFFCMTVLSTIGYGFQIPVTVAGQAVCVIYALTGIPLTGMMLVWTSDFFSEQLFKLFKAKLDAKKQQSNMFIALFTLICIAVGLVVFIFIPAGIFTVIDYWSYLEAVYFAVITLTTVGFGDLLTGMETRGWVRSVYEVCIIVWIMTGLGYWVTVVNFITKALKSKRQSSLLRSAEEMKSLVQQMGIKDTDPRFLSFAQQLSNFTGVAKGALATDATAFPSASSPAAAPAMN